MQMAGFLYGLNMSSRSLALRVYIPICCIILFVNQSIVIAWRNCFDGVRNDADFTGAGQFMDCWSHSYLPKKQLEPLLDIVPCVAQSLPEDGKLIACDISEMMDKYRSEILESRWCRSEN